MGDGLGRAGGDAAAERIGARRRLAALAAGFLVLAIGVAVVLSQSAWRPIGSNEINASATIGPLIGGGRICQTQERILAGTGALRITVASTSAAQPQLDAALLSGATTVARDGGAARWSDGAVVVGIHPVVARTTPGRVCVTLADPEQKATMMLRGQAATSPATIGSQPLPIRLRVDYLRPTEQSWWSFIPTVTDRIGLGHAWSGTSVALVALLLTLSSIGLAAWQVTRAAK